MENIFDLTWKILTYVMPILTGLIGIFVGALLSNRQNQIQRKLDFCEKQLKEFYSPLVGIRKEIQILKEVELLVEKASDEWWKDVCKIGEKLQPSEAQKYYDEKGKGIDGPIKYDNDQFRIKILPAYRKLVEVFKHNYYLAEEKTKEYFSTLIKFVEMWERFLSETHPREVIKRVDISEKELLPFYQHLEETLETLRRKLKEGKL